MKIVIYLKKIVWLVIKNGLTLIPNVIVVLSLFSKYVYKYNIKKCFEIRLVFKLELSFVYLL